MEITYDPAKNQRNIDDRDLSFDRAADMDFETASFFVDERKDYFETRHIAIGYLDDRLHVLCYLDYNTGIRVISFCKANSREARRYGKPLTINE